MIAYKTYIISPTTANYINKERVIAYLTNYIIIHLYPTAIVNYNIY